MAFVYVLEFPSGKFYIGSTADIQSRLKHHMGGHTPSTKRLGAQNGKLVFWQEYPSLTDARSVERKLKGLKRRDYIANIVQDGYIKIVP